MAEENNGSAAAGSPIGSGVPNPNNLAGATGGDTKVETPAVDPVQHKELEALVGRQGAELGEFRKFFQDIAPLLDKLDKSPELVQAIIDEKLTPELAKAALEGKISVADAAIVTKAQEEVKKDLGKEGMKGASPEEISKLVEDKAKEIAAAQQSQQDAAIQAQKEKEGAQAAGAGAETEKHGAIADKASAEALANQEQAGLFRAQAGAVAAQPPSGSETGVQ